jgi:hypothetical protein
MTNVKPIAPGFQKGEAVVLARGSHPGTRGVFLQLREDPLWADIQETSDGEIRSHPVEWLDHVTGTAAA